MKRLLGFSLLALSVVGSTLADSSRPNGQPGNGDAFGQTFFYVRPPYQSAMPEKETLMRNWAMARECGWNGALELVPFGGRSTAAKRLGYFFEPIPKDSLIVSSANAGTTALSEGIGRDINPFYFGIDFNGAQPNYSSVIQFRPRQSFAGLGMTWRQYFGKHYEDGARKWYFEASAPVEWVSNDMRLTETNIVTVGASVANHPANMTAAFQGASATTPYVFPDGNAMKYGLINGKQHKTGLADIELKLGYEYVNCETHHFDGYFGVLIPTGNKPKAVYVFEPIVGHNKQFALMMGSNLGFEIWNSCDGSKSLRFEFAHNGRYFFDNTQTRSFDLVARPWSRYMIVYANAAAATAGTYGSAINYLTQRLKVNARFSNNFLTGFVLEGTRWEAEVGYNVWHRQAESVELKTPWAVGPAIVDLTSYAAAGPDINRLSNISNDNSGAGIAYTTASAIQATDLNLASAANPAAISNTIYCSLGYHCKEWRYPTFMGLGGAYEFSYVNTALNRWTVWGKIGVAF